MCNCVTGKFIAKICAIIIIASNVSNAALEVEWSGQSTGALLYNNSGSALTTPATYRIEMIIDVNGDTDMSALLSGYVGNSADVGASWLGAVDSTAVDDVVFDAYNWENAAGDVLWFGTQTSPDLTAYASSAYYFRWFDTSSQTTASGAGIIYGSGGSTVESGWSVGNVSPPVSSDNAAVDFANANSLGSTYTAALPANDGWQTVAPVPEPGSMALFAIGLVTLAVRRRRR